MIDVKKFVVAFFAIAVIAGGSALFLGRSPDVTAKVPQAAGGPAAISLGNVFANGVGSSGGADPGTATDTALDDPNNLTGQLADSMLNNLFAANPNGPQTDANGNTVIAEPSAQSILADVSTSSAENVDIPDWDFDAAMITTNVSTDTSDAAVTSYASALSAITNNYFVASGVQGMVGDGSGGDASNIPYISSQIQGALSKISALTVPSNLVGFHKDFIKLLVYEKNGLALAADASDDPAKSAVIFQAENAKYEAAVQSFENDWQTVSQNKAFSLAMPGAPGGPSGIADAVNKIFGIPTAHAQWIVFDPTTFAQMVWEWVQGVLLQILKNTIITQLQNKVFALIKNAGNGAPQFVQSWTTYLANAFEQSAGSALGQIIPTLCPSFNTQVTGWLQNVYTNSNVTPNGFSLNGSPPTQCNLQTSVPNVPAYYNDFNTAGFAGFAAIAAPSNNPFGTFAEGYDESAGVAGTQQNAAQSKAVAGSGFPGQGLCDDGSEPSPDGLCGDGSEPYSVTPGSSLNNALGRNLSSNIDLVVNANSITDLLATITTDLLQQVINSGANGLFGAPPSGSGHLPPPPPPPLPLTCSVPVTTASTSAPIYFTATGGTSDYYTWNAPGGNPSSGNSSLFTTTFIFPGVYVVSLSNTGQNNWINCASVTIQ